MTVLPISDDMIKEVDDALNALLNLYSSVASRSVSIGIVNNTGFTLNQDQVNMLHGGIDPQFDLPAASIPPGGADKFSVATTGFLTGVEGTAIYTATDSDGNDAGVSIQLYFDNPEVTDNLYTAQVVVTSPPPAATFKAHQTGSAGNHSKVRYDISAS